MKIIIVPLGNMLWGASPCPTYIEVPYAKSLMGTDSRLEIWKGIYSMLEVLGKESGKNIRSFDRVSKTFEHVYQSSGKIVG